MSFLSDYFHGLFSVFYSSYFIVTFKVLFNLFPFWGPILLAFGLYMVWIEYIRAKFLAKQKYVLLELHLPREVFKSPLAMELALSGLYVTAGETTWWDVYVLGKVRAWFSLEIVSNEGNIHFYIWTREGYRNVVEAQIYGQYPGIEVYEVPDYTEVIPYFDESQMFLVGQEYKLKKADPYPIKTYVDFGLDKDPEEEFKVDPLTSVLEYLATLKRGEHMWLQILMQAHKKKAKKAEGVWSSIFPESTDIQHEAKELIDELLEELKQDKITADGGTISYSRIATKSEAEVMGAIDRSAGKLNYDCGIRLIYAARPESVNFTRVTHSIALFRPFASKELNEIEYRWGTYFSIDWLEDPFGLRAKMRKSVILKAYRLRSWFHGPYKRKPFILSSEELATLFHPVGSVLQAPSVERIMSKKSEAPTNLPY